ncbi:MAG TPA: hypothetical protein VKE41_00475 [Roseiflexaceae bacterium]|nr:hypothetical protein [Roseiflexaceae bacterium]
MQTKRLEQPLEAQAHTRWPQAAILAGILLVAHVLWLLPLPLVWKGVGVELLLAAPGALLGILLFRAEPDPLARGFLACCGAIALQVPLLLAISSQGQVP